MDTSRTLEQLEGRAWGEPPADSSGLMLDVYRLRQVPVGNLTNDDLRLMLGQVVGSDWLIPIALDRLGEDPLAGDLYPGDLLRAVLHAGTDYWTTHPDEVVRLWNVRASLSELRDAADRLLGQSDWPAFG